MIAGLVLSGCQLDTRPQDLSHFATNRFPPEEAAPYRGTYALFSEETVAATPLLMQVHLEGGEIIGFETDRDHVPYAVVGHERLKLAPGHYRWEMRPDPGQTDWNKTSVVIIEVVVATAVVVVAVVTTVLLTRGLH